MFEIPPVSSSYSFSMSPSQNPIEQQIQLFEQNYKRSDFDFNSIKDAISSLNISQNQKNAVISQMNYVFTLNQTHAGQDKIQDGLNLLDAFGNQSNLDALNKDKKISSLIMTIKDDYENPPTNPISGNPDLTNLFTHIKKLQTLVNTDSSLDPDLKSSFGNFIKDIPTAPQNISDYENLGGAVNALASILTS